METDTREAVREWAMKLAPGLADTLRQNRRGAVGTCWYVDETYIKVQRHWNYLYRAIDRAGNLIDTRLSNSRALAAAEAFFRSARRVTGVVPARITTDGHDAYPRAVRSVFGDRVTHRTNRYLNNQLEIVFTQLPKTHVLTPWMGRYDLADFDLIMSHDDTIDQQLDQAPLLLERSVR